MLVFEKENGYVDRTFILNCSSIQISEINLAIKTQSLKNLYWPFFIQRVVKHYKNRKNTILFHYIFKKQQKERKKPDQHDVRQLSLVEAEVKVSTLLALKIGSCRENISFPHVSIRKGKKKYQVV